jgi:hypothetical protein
MFLEMSSAFACARQDNSPLFQIFSYLFRYFLDIHQILLKMSSSSKGASGSAATSDAYVKKKLATLFRYV